MSTITVRRTDQLYRRGRVCADFVVDGRSLLSLFPSEVRRAGLLPCLGWGPRSTQDAWVAQLLLAAPCPQLPDGRVPLYGCKIDMDVACGAVTVQIERDADWVVWRDFRYETGLPDLDPRCQASGMGLEKLGPYRFARAEYEAAIGAGHGMDGFDEAAGVTSPGLWRRLLRLFRIV